MTVDAEPAAIVTLAEANYLLGAQALLQEISDRATAAAYEAPTGLTFPRPARAQDYGRLAGVASLAADGIFTAVCSAGTYCLQAGANQAIDDRSAARAAEGILA